MCGLAAFFDPDGRSPEPAWLDAAAASLGHRGPDDAGMHIEPGIGLAFRRLSIVDLATGHQPLANEDGTVWIVYNGEVYNHAELRRELESRGHRYRTQSDTETIVHAYEEWGEACVGRLRGMFAFVIWDRPRRRLFVARDRLGSSRKGDRSKTSRGPGDLPRGSRATDGEPSVGRGLGVAAEQARALPIDGAP